MYPDEPFAEGRGSFLRPVPIPLTNPDASPTLTLSINCDWLPYIRGALQQLLLQSTWQDGIDPLNVTQGRVFNLIDLFTECASVAPPFACPYDFTHSSSETPWSIVGRGDIAAPFGLFVPTVGINSVSAFEAGGGNYWQGLTVQMTLPVPIHLGVMELTWANYTRGDDYGGHLHDNDSGFVIWRSGSVVGTHLVPSTDLTGDSGTFAFDFTGLEADMVEIDLLAGVSSSSPALGNITLVDAIISGHAGDFSCP